MTSITECTLSPASRLGPASWRIVLIEQAQGSAHRTSRPDITLIGLKARSAKTEGERQQLRTEHRKMVKERAQARKAQIQEQMDDAFFVPALSPL